MYYSAVALLALAVNVILNRKSIMNIFAKTDAQDAEQQVKVCYSHFLHAINLYYLVEIAWGILYGNHNNPKLFTIIYINMVFYFIFMLLTMFAWARYIVAYLESDDIRAEILDRADRAMYENKQKLKTTG